MTTEALLSVPGVPFKVATQITDTGNRLEFQFGYCKPLMEEIKAMEGAKYHGYDANPRKIWSVAKSARTKFAIDYLMGVDVFKQYDLPVDPRMIKGEYHSKNPEDKVYPHQLEMAAFGLTRKRCILAGEMGVGKTLAAIIVMQESGFNDWWWIGTKASLKAVEYEFRKWNSKIIPRLLSYDSVKKLIGPDGKMLCKPPKGLFCDESARVKTATSQRSVAVRTVSETMNAVYADEAHVILMCGAPAPKDPCDWWNQCEIAKPGFLREGTVAKLRQRLSVNKKADGGNGVYFEHVTWLDDDRKCLTCGKFKDDPVHTGSSAFGDDDVHPWKASVNEVQKLYERMHGLVLVKLKKDVLRFLPQKRYEIIRMPPTPSIVRTAKLLSKTAPNVITAMTLLRELSDGFQYTEVEDGTQECQCCKGTKLMDQYFDPENPEKQLFDEQPKTTWIKKSVDCGVCGATGAVPKYKRGIQEVPTPKEEALEDLLDLHEDVGRLVVYAGFTGSIDRCVNIAHKALWSTIRVDSRGWDIRDCFDNPITGVEAIPLFQELLSEHPRVCFIAQAGSAGTGLTLTRSPGICYYSNSFNGDDRIQSEDRIHRPGMDVNRGATIYDLIHLPTDQYILDNLKKKRELQAMTMGDVISFCDENLVENRSY